MAEKAYDIKAESLFLLKIDPKIVPLRSDMGFDYSIARAGFKK